MIKSNYHTHTKRCNHATGTEEDYVISAIKNNINILGFSDHGPFKNIYHDFKMNYSELNEYFAALDNLKLKYNNHIKILEGLEIEFFDDQINYYEELYTKYNLDYLLLGQHMWKRKNIDNKIVDGNSIKSTDDIFYYSDAVCAAMNTKLFKIIGHPDFFMRFNYPVDKNIEKITYNIINCAVKNNSILEFNANGIRMGLKEYIDGKRFMYPSKFFWNQVKETELKITINSDCHNPNDIWDNSMEKAYDIAYKWGLKHNIINDITPYL